jgi:hypothetical protein
LSKHELKIDWASHEAAKFACVNWHYSKCIPKSKLVKIGVWEDSKFIGVVIFSPGATPNLGSPYGLSQDRCVELTRVALTQHKSEVTRIIKVALIFLKKHSPLLKLVVSFADQDQNHVGGIYQAGNWVYNGIGSKAKFYLINGKKTHPRTIGSAGYVQNLDGAKKIDRNAQVILCQGKHRYLMPLDKEMKKQIEPLAKPYPKRGLIEEQQTPSVDGGASPTSTLQTLERQVKANK